MRKLVMYPLLVAITLALMGFSRAPVPRPPRPSGDFPIERPTPVPSYAPGDVRFEPVEYYSTPQERVKIQRAGKKAKEVIQSGCFRSFMSHRALIQTNGRTPAGVAEHVQRLSGVVPVAIYYRWRGSAVAKRYVGSDTLWLNRRDFTLATSDCEWAATLGHEGYGHILGEYDHDYRWNPERSWSVPYSIGGADRAQGGDAFQACCREGG